MALVAYSDESDMDSCEEEEDSSQVNLIKSNKQNLSNFDTKGIKDSSKSTESSKKNNPIKEQVNDCNTIITSGIDDIVDEDDNFLVDKNEKNISYNEEDESIMGLLSSIPAPNLHSTTNLETDSEMDQVTDVPTVKTWKLTKDLGHEEMNKIKPVKILQGNQKRKKLQFILPSLAEFSDDEEEEKIEPVKKRPLPSNTTSGLFSLLPPPTSLTVKQPNRFLVPHALTKKPEPIKKPTKPKVTKPTNSNPLTKTDLIDEEEEDIKDNNNDFFSLSSVDDEPIINVPVITSDIAPVINTQKYNTPDISRTLVSNGEPTRTNNHIVETDLSNIPTNIGAEYIHNDYKNETINSGISEEALIKLTGRRNRRENIDIVDFSADDVLLDREEWVNKALTEEKPTFGFSNKKDDMPTQQQKRKHQITYLARQAQEREAELKNSWATNRATKKETQSKYGF